MTHYPLPTPPGSPKGRFISACWDASLGTYSVLAFDVPISLDDKPVKAFHYGITAGEIPSTQVLLAVVAELDIDLPVRVLWQLQQDKAHHSSRGAVPRPAVTAALQDGLR
ncbi:hypothetical protein [Streptosporangium sp. NPDC001681]|uniref:hypothetical protein n=1 Tax=Streptosporangium sp. NPDC001681 TaxID=3154395 RepID=UPI003331A212